MSGKDSRQLMEQRQQQGEAMRLFAQAFSSGAKNAQALDRFGRPMDVGMKVIYRPPFDLVFDVVDVQPVLDPRMQPGMVNVTISAKFAVTIPIQRGPVPNFVIVAMSEPSVATTDETKPSDGDNVIPGTFGTGDGGDPPE